MSLEGTVNTRNNIIAYVHVAVTDYERLKGEGLNRIPLAKI
jgi:hypothetical protein